MGGHECTIYDATIEVFNPAVQSWVNVATGLLFTDGAKRGISLRGGDVPQNVLNDLVENADLAERSGTSEVALETTQFKLTFKRKAFYSI